MYSVVMLCSYCLVYNPLSVGWFILVHIAFAKDIEDKMP